MWDAALLSTPSVQNKSLTAMGRPSRGRASALAAAVVGPVGRGERAFGCFRDNRVEGARPFHGSHMRLGELAGAEVAGGEPIAGLRHGQSRELAHALLDHLGHDEESPPS